MAFGFLLALPGLAGKLLDYVNKRADNAVTIEGKRIDGDVSLSQAQLTAYIEERKILAQARAGLSGSGWTSWMIPFAFLVSMYHFSAIVLDSVHHFNWQISKLPPPYDDLQIKIIWTVVGIGGVYVAAKKIFSK